MKKLSLISAFIFALAVPAFADPLEGVWKTEVDDGNYAHIKIGKCGAKFCGHIARSFNASGEFQSENIGKKLVIDMVPKGDNYYKGVKPILVGASLRATLCRPAALIFPVRLKNLTEAQDCDNFQEKAFHLGNVNLGKPEYGTNKNSLAGCIWPDGFM